MVYTRYAVKQHAGWRNLGSRFANAVADRLLDKPKGLYLSSFRCMSAMVVQAVTRYSGPYPYVDGLIMQVTQRIDSIEVRHLPRLEGRSNYTLTRLVRLWLNLATSFSLAPLRLAIFAGLGMSMLGAIGAVATITEALFVHETPSGWASTMTVLLLVSGVQSMILGVLGEYVGRTFLSANGKPQGTVRSDPAQHRGTDRHERLLADADGCDRHQHGRPDTAEDRRRRAGFRRQLFDPRTLVGLVPVWRGGVAVYHRAAADSDVGRAALHRDFLCRGGA